MVVQHTRYGEYPYSEIADLLAIVTDLQHRVAELERQSHPEPIQYNAPFNTDEQCRAGACSFYGLYLAQGPADMGHHSFHLAETAAVNHGEHCTAEELKCAVCAMHERVTRS